MGRGCAREARDRLTNLDFILGQHALSVGNTPLILMNHALMSFPVKHEWFQKADIQLIRQSAKSLQEFAEASSSQIFVLPRPGCGNGGLEWLDVRGVLLEVGLPDNVWTIPR